MLKKIQDSHKHSKKNTANSAPLAKLARVECADDKDPDNRDKNGRLAVECGCAHNLRGPQRAELLNGFHEVHLLVIGDDEDAGTRLCLPKLEDVTRPGGLPYDFRGRIGGDEYQFDSKATRWTTPLRRCDFTLGYSPFVHLIRIFTCLNCAYFKILGYVPPTVPVDVPLDSFTIKPLVNMRIWMPDEVSRGAVFPAGEFVAADEPDDLGADTELETRKAIVRFV